ncbi:putative serine-rich protein [Cocos nucifera]|uniref:Putative serine-rich protein n=1 Tax=Cocos nucifera TaxID=13894 RepID=A0A8K0N0E1_COCNU|nr:putative serine-rich protein [Cocos nucifera]
MLSNTSNRPQSPLRIKQDDKFYSRLLSKESSLANPSFRVYYGVTPGSVPFLWESEPGTPKAAVATATLPPLTPPPSSHFNPMKSKATKKKKKKKPSSRLSLITTLFLRLTPRKAHLASPPMSSPSLSSSSSSYSSQFESSVSHQRRRFLCSRSSFSSRSRDYEDYDKDPPRSIFCFQEVPEAQRADAANSLVYEANMRLRDPVYGCMGAVSALQQQVQALEVELRAVRAEILKHKGRQASVRVFPTSHAALFAPSGDVPVAAPPPIPTPPPRPASSASSSSIYTTPPSTSSTDYNSINPNQNVTFFG